MNRKEQESLTRKLRQQRETLFKEVADTEADLEFLSADRESELEERAQEERSARLLARLDERGKRAIEEIDAALKRMADGLYGRCAACAKTIPAARLRALPATRYCLGCAQQRETQPPGAPAATEAPATGAVPGSMALLRDREIEEALRERVREDERIDTEELRIVCRHGVVYLDGVLPSEGEHQILEKLVMDIAGLHEVVDRIQVKELLWQREDRSKEHPAEPKLPWTDEASTEDVVESIEEGLEYVPPVNPIPEEEK